MGKSPPAPEVLTDANVIGLLRTAATTGGDGRVQWAPPDQFLTPPNHLVTFAGHFANNPTSQDPNAFGEHLLGNISGNGASMCADVWAPTCDFSEKNNFDFYGRGFFNTIDTTPRNKALRY